jgi:hypothetical protein
VSAAAAAQGIETVASISARNTFYADPDNQSKLVYVNNNNGSSADPANGVYEYVDGAARLAQGFYAGISIIMQPYVDAAQEKVDAAETAAETAAALVDPFTAIGANMSATARALSSVSIGAMTTAGTSTSTTYAQTRDAATVPVRAILNSVTVDVTADANVTVVVMEPAWRNTDKVIATVTTALAAGDGRAIDLGKLVVQPGTRVFVRLNSGTLRSDAAASVLYFAWAGFSNTVGATALIRSGTGAFGMTVNYSPLVDEIDTNASAAAAIDRDRGHRQHRRIGRCRHAYLGWGDPYRMGDGQPRDPERRHPGRDADP